jgi:hypothetical protein
MIVVLSAVLAIVAVVWMLQTLISSVPLGGSLKTQVMHRKSMAMQTILDGLIRGDLQRVETAASQLVDYGKMIEHFLSSAEYEKHGEDFRNSVGDVIDASAREDKNSAKEAVLRLERSCIECHLLMNQRDTQGTRQ